MGTSRYRAERPWPPAIGLPLALAVLCLLVLAGLVAGHSGDRLAGMDRALYLLFRDATDPGLPLGPAWLREAVRDLTALGSTLVLGIVTATAALFLLLLRRQAEVLLLLAAVLGGQVLISLLKLAFARPRPDLAPHAAEVFTASFPSGHAGVSAATYLTLALVLRATASPRLAGPGLLLAGLMIVGIGASRLYLGVHWPSDILAGWCLGTAWALSCWAGYAAMLRRTAAMTGRKGAGPA